MQLNITFHVQPIYEQSSNIIKERIMLADFLKLDIKLSVIKLRHSECNVFNFRLVLCLCLSREQTSYQTDGGTEVKKKARASYILIIYGKSWYSSSDLSIRAFFFVISKIVILFVFFFFLTACPFSQL